MTEHWRCFVAVPLDDGLRRSLGTAIAGWRDDPRTDGLRWVAPDALHLTLATGRLGAFARPGSARVLWYAVGDPDAALAGIAADLDTELRLGATEPYRPHVTIARARRRSVDLRGWIETASEAAPVGTLGVRELRLMRSHLGGGPARYETIATAPLGVTAHV